MAKYVPEELPVFTWPETPADLPHPIIAEAFNEYEEAIVNRDQFDETEVTRRGNVCVFAADVAMEFLKGQNVRWHSYMAHYFDGRTGTHMRVLSADMWRWARRFSEGSIEVKDEVLRRAEGIGKISVLQALLDRDDKKVKHEDCRPKRRS